MGDLEALQWAVKDQETSAFSGLWNAGVNDVLLNLKGEQYLLSERVVEGKDCKSALLP